MFNTTTTFDNNSTGNITTIFPTLEEEEAIFEMVRISDIRWWSYFISQNLIIVLNAIAILILKDLKSLPQFTLKLMISLCFADSILGWSGQIRLFYLLIGQDLAIKHTWFCHFDAFFLHISDMASIVNMTLITLFKFLSIYSPFKYARFETNKVANTCIVILWLYSFLISLDPAFRSGSVYYVKQALICQYIWANNIPSILTILFALYVPVIITFVSDVKLFLIIKKQATHIANNTIQDLKDKTSGLNTVKSHFKALKTIVILHLGFIIAWSPYMFTILMPTFLYGKPYKPLLFWSCFFAISNSFWNPIIYVLTVREFREKFFKMIHIKSSNEHENSVSAN